MTSLAVWLEGSVNTEAGLGTSKVSVCETRCAVVWIVARLAGRLTAQAGGANSIIIVSDKASAGG